MFARSALDIETLGGSRARPKGFPGSPVDPRHRDSQASQRPLPPLEGSKRGQGTAGTGLLPLLN